MSKIYTTADIEKIARESGILHMRDGDRLTDLAKYAARSKNVQIISGEEYPEPENKREFGQYEQAIRSEKESEPYDLVIVGGTCVIPEMGLLKANVCVKNGKICSLTTKKPGAKESIDAKGLYVLPGVIDPHTHLGLFTSLEEELYSETRSAILGGVTTIGTYFNSENSYLPFVRELEEMVKRLSSVDIIPHLAIRTEEQRQEMPRYSEMGMNSFKVYMCGVKGIYPNQEDGFIVQVMEEMRALPPWANPILSIHCENQSICDMREEQWKGAISDLSDWNETHPDFAEGEAVQRAAYLALKQEVRTYVVHSSTKEAMELLDRVKNPYLTVETTSPYLCLDTKSDIGAYGKMLPPIRDEESRKALWEGILKGTIDTIGTDNTVMTTAEKKVFEGMESAGAGYPTLGTHLPSVLTEGVFRQEIGLEKLVPLLTMNPAKAFGVYPQKGTIMPGSDADMVLVDLNGEKVVRPESLLSRSDFSLFQGKTLKGWPKATIKAGKIVAFDGKLTQETGAGTIVRH